LRQFIELGPAKKVPNWGETPVMVNHHRCAQPFGSLPHRPKLDDPEQVTLISHSRLAKERLTPRGQADQ
jgi:hypothetical protein